MWESIHVHTFICVNTGYLQRSHTVHTQMGETGVHMYVCVYTHLVRKYPTVNLLNIQRSCPQMAKWDAWLGGG